MPLSCPVCRATTDAGPTCRRCKADLSMLFAVEAQRAAHLEEARLALAQGQPDEAFELMCQASELRNGSDIARLNAVLFLRRRDFGEAWRQYQRARALSDGKA